MGDLREVDDGLLESASVTCSKCGVSIVEEEVQAARWGYWSDGCGVLYPYCPPCAARELEHHG
jgi:ferredoxin-like protein FixX